jgi:hypothetical protein
MVGLGDIVDLLKRWDRWRRIDETPERVDALEKRITELEARLQRARVQRARRAANRNSASLARNRHVAISRN